MSAPSISSGRVLVVGSYNTDLVTFGGIPRRGETLLVERFETLSGGKGANQAIAAARLGARVAFCGRVGNDAHGEQARRLLIAEDVGDDGVVVDPSAHTGVAMVLVDRGGENAIAVASGANANLSSQDLDQRESLFADADVLLVQLETPLATVHSALELGRRHGCINVLDPAPAAPLSDELLSLVDLLTPNESEASSLLGCEVGDVDSALAAGRALRARGCGRAIVTLGARGSVFVDCDACWHVFAPSVPVVDTTGAGDAFNGALAAELAAGGSWLDSTRLATRAAASSVGRSGVLRGLPRRQDLSNIQQPETLQL